MLALESRLFYQSGALYHILFVARPYLILHYPLSGNAVILRQFNNFSNNYVGKLYDFL